MRKMLEQRLDVIEGNGSDEEVDVGERHGFDDALHERHVVEFEGEDERLFVVFVVVKSGFDGGGSDVEFQFERIECRRYVEREYVQTWPRRKSSKISNKFS